MLLWEQVTAPPHLTTHIPRDLLTQLQLFNQKMAFLDKLVSGIAKGK